ncbi:MAG: M20 family metallopeptidase [Gemmatimonadetes bacterium]|nr:M20 family metallopeptidase [Gemmatimonadota bacterium]
MSSATSILEDVFSTSVRQELLELRHNLHRHPELAFQEERTARTLHEYLGRLEPKVLARIADTGVVARIKGRDPDAPVVAVRGDIDALPIQEDTGLDFASVNSGVMHACGHDVHATWAVGAAHLLSQQPAAGDVLIVLQPAEETGRGASKILESGALDDASAIFGAHVDRRFAVGEVVADVGPLAASADTFSIELVGSGAHGARPQEGIDPIVGMASLITELQIIVARRIDPGTAAVVTVGTVQAGTAPNVIPGTASLSGTLRAIEPETRAKLHDELRAVAEHTAAAHHLEVAVDIEHGTPPIVNPEEPVAWARRAVSSLLGDEALKPLGTVNMGGEDFAFYMEKLPGCFLRIGAREQGGKVIPGHNPKFYAADESIFVGAAVLAETARIASEALR